MFVVTGNPFSGLQHHLKAKQLKQKQCEKTRKGRNPLALFLRTVSALVRQSPDSYRENSHARYPNGRRDYHLKV